MNLETKFAKSIGDPGSTSNKEELKTLEDDSSLSLKQKRDEYQIEIRKKVREEILNSKRRPVIQFENKIQKMTESGQMQKTPENAKLKEFIDQTVNKEFTLNDFHALVVAIKSNDRFEQHYGCIGIRKILSVDGPPIQQVIDANVVPRLIEFIQKPDEPHLQIESAWAITNLTTGPSRLTKAVIDKGAIPLLIDLLKSPNLQVTEQAIWALANISGDSSDLRDKVIKCGAVDPLIEFLNVCNDDIIFKHGIWALSNICRGSPPPKFEFVYKAIAPFAQAIKFYKDSEMLVEASWGLCHLSDGNSTQIAKVLNADVIPTVLRLIQENNIAIMLPNIRILGNICCGDDSQCDAVLKQPDFCKTLLYLLNHEKRPVKRESLALLSSIMSGTTSQIQMVIGYPEILQRLIQLCESNEPEISKDAIWSLCKITNHGTIEQVYCLVQGDFLNVLVGNLDIKANDPELLAVCLEAISNILAFGRQFIPLKGQNIFLTLFESLKGVEKVEKLQAHKSDDVHVKALSILETYFDLEEAI